MARITFLLSPGGRVAGAERSQRQDSEGERKQAPAGSRAWRQESSEANPRPPARTEAQQARRLNKTLEGLTSQELLSG